MINLGKFPVLGVNIDAVDYEYAVQSIAAAAEEGRPFAVSATAVHGVMVGARDPVHARRLNGLDLVVPDGQPVRWALRWLYGKTLPDRVRGPDLTLYVAKAFAERSIPVYLYGSTLDVLDKFASNLCARFPGLVIAGKEPSRFRRLDESERKAVVERIAASGAKAVFVGLGCPRQEVWAFEYRTVLRMPLLAVGAAYDFHAGTLPEAPRFMQEWGLEWLFRLLQEPTRLWRRYLILNPLYLWGIAFQKVGLHGNGPRLPDGSETIESYG